MVPFLYGPREVHGARTGAEYRAKHAAFIATRQRQGERVEVHDSPAPLKARIDANRWLVDCECNNGNVTTPALGFACCFGCGAVHETIVFPEDPYVIEALLIARPDVKSRGWDIVGQFDPVTRRDRMTDQTLIDLIAEAVSVNAVVPDVAIEAVLAAENRRGDP